MRLRVGCTVDDARHRCLFCEAAAATHQKPKRWRVAQPCPATGRSSGGQSLASASTCAHSLY